MHRIDTLVHQTQKYETAMKAQGKIDRWIDVALVIETVIVLALYVSQPPQWRVTRPRSGFIGTYTRRACRVCRVRFNGRSIYRQQPAPLPRCETYLGRNHHEHVSRCPLH